MILAFEVLPKPFELIISDKIYSFFKIMTNFTVNYTHTHKKNVYIIIPAFWS